MVMASNKVDLRIAFLGTFHPAVPTFRVLAEHKWVCVVILPEEAGYKNDELLQLIHDYSVPYSYDISDIQNFEPNLLLAANYPKLVPSRFLEAYPCINTHWSLLPRWRGVHPTAWAVINGDEEIGLSVHLMEEDFDTGDILAQESVRMKPEMNINELHEILAQKQAEAVFNVLKKYAHNGVLSKFPQDETKAIYVPQRYPEDGIINWSWPALRIEGLVRALPLPKYPGAFTYADDRKVVISSAKAINCPPYYCTPGQVIRVFKEGPVWVKAGDTCLEVQEIMFEDTAQRISAKQGLKRGMKLGYDPQIEIARLKAQITALQAQLQQSK